MHSLYMETPAHATHFRIIFPFSPSDISLFPFGAVCGKIPAETFSKEEYPLSAIAEILAGELSQKREYIENVIALLDEGNTIPFIARYRTELH